MTPGAVEEPLREPVPVAALTLDVYDGASGPAVDGETLVVGLVAAERHLLAAESVHHITPSAGNEVDWTPAWLPE